MIKLYSNINCGLGPYHSKMFSSFSMGSEGKRKKIYNHTDLKDLKRKVNTM